MLSTMNFPGNPLHSSYSEIDENYRELKRNLPTHALLISEILQKSIGNSDSANKIDTAFETYLMHPKHLEATYYEELILTKYAFAKPINWDDLISYCLKSINLRISIVIAPNALSAQHLNNMLLLRTYILLINFNFANLRLTGKNDQLNKNLKEANDILDKNLENSSLTKAEEMLKINYYHICLLNEIYTYESNQTEDAKTNNLNRIKLYINCLFEIESEKDNAQRILANSYLMSLLIENANEIDEEYYSIFKLNYIFSEIIKSNSDKWSVNVIAKLIHIFMEIDLSKVEEENKCFWEEVIGKALFVVEKRPHMQECYEMLKTRYKNTLNIEYAPKSESKKETVSAKNLTNDQARIQNLLVIMPSAIALTLYRYNSIKIRFQQNSLKTYLASPDHVAAILDEEALFVILSEGNNLNKAIDICLASINKRRKIDTLNLGSQVLELHHLLLQRTYTFLLTLQHEKSILEGDTDNILSIIDRALENSKQIISLSQYEKMILANFYLSLLSPMDKVIDVSWKEMKNESDCTEAEMIQYAINGYIDKMNSYINYSIKLYVRDKEYKPLKTLMLSNCPAIISYCMKFHIMDSLFICLDLLFSEFYINHSVSSLSNMKLIFKNLALIGIKPSYVPQWEHCMQKAIVICEELDELKNCYAGLCEALSARIQGNMQGSDNKDGNRIKPSPFGFKMPEVESKDNDAISKSTDEDSNQSQSSHSSSEGSESENDSLISGSDNETSDTIESSRSGSERSESKNDVDMIESKASEEIHDKGKDIDGNKISDKENRSCKRLKVLAHDKELSNIDFKKSLLFRGKIFKPYKKQEEKDSINENNQLQSSSINAVMTGFSQVMRKL